MVIISNFRHPLHMCGRMQLQSSNFVHNTMLGQLYGRLLPANQILCRDAAVVTEMFTRHLHNALSSENAKCYFRDTSYNGWPHRDHHPEQLCLSDRRGFVSPRNILVVHCTDLCDTLDSLSISSYRVAVDDIQVRCRNFHRPGLLARAVARAQNHLCVPLCILVLMVGCNFDSTTIRRRIGLSIGLSFSVTSNNKVRELYVFYLRK